MPNLIQTLLQKRGFKADFLQPKYTEAIDQILAKNNLKILEIAAKRLLQAAKNHEKVLIYGDYDADGVTASAVMTETLRLIGIEQVEVMLPDRFKDGYGMSQRSLEFATKIGAKLVVTVDCGSNNNEVISALKKAGIDTIVTDHHELQGEIPDAVSVLNFKRPDQDFSDELKQLAGVGVAFMLAYQLMKMQKIPAGQEKWLLDLVLIGTICDSMVMTGLNRVLGFYGLKVLAKTRRVGLRELIRSANIKQIDSNAVGFLLGPRINAAGRLANAKLALDLILTNSKIEALKLATQLEKLNSERQTKQRQAVTEITQRGLGENPVIVEQGDWHEGIMGIVAGRLLEQYHRPSLVLSESKPGILKGSGRSKGDFSLALALKYCADYLETGGGHAEACGLSLKTENFTKFKTAINQYYKDLNLKNQEVFFQQQADLAVRDFSELNLDFWHQLQRFEPFGAGNTEPVLLFEEVFVLSVRRMGAEQQHLKLNLRDNFGHNFSVLAWFAPKNWLEVPEASRINLWVSLFLSEWNGSQNLEGKILRLEQL